MRQPHLQGFVAFLPFLKITRRAPKPGPFPAGPKTLGQHPKQRRLELGLLQREAAARLGVSEWTVINWETGLRQPRVTYCARIIEFLGFDPLAPAPGDEVSLSRRRRSLGLSRRALAGLVGVDEGTLRDLDLGRRRSTCATRAKVERFLGRRADRARDLYG